MCVEKCQKEALMENFLTYLIMCSVVFIISYPILSYGMAKLAQARFRKYVSSKGCWTCALGKDNSYEIYDLYGNQIKLSCGKIECDKEYSFNQFWSAQHFCMYTHIFAYFIGLVPPLERYYYKILFYVVKSQFHPRGN